MSDGYKTSCRIREEVLPGWNCRDRRRRSYRLSKEHSAAAIAQTDVYGYLLGTANPDGHVGFSFHEIKPDDVSVETRARYATDTVTNALQRMKMAMLPRGRSARPSEDLR